MTVEHAARFTVVYIGPNGDDRRDLIDWTTPDVCYPWGDESAEALGRRVLDHLERYPQGVVVVTRRTP